MQKFFSLVMPAAGALGFALAVSAPADAASGANGGRARASMQQCVQKTLAGLAKSRAPESQVGGTVVAQCQQQLRATLQEAISTGQAGGCTVESCLGMAQQRTAEEAVMAYRQLGAR